MCRYCEKNELLLDGMEELIYIDNGKLNISNIVNNTIKGLLISNFLIIFFKEYSFFISKILFFLDASLILSILLFITSSYFSISKTLFENEK